jgi:hypothetical protein|tara:strand:+ start:482 stop:790 length:309 start_codon:yes stop_codon:yes gene_type:complete
MSNTNTQSLNYNSYKQGKDTKKEDTKNLFNILKNKTLSRRMAATELGFIDQTYMVTSNVSKWIKLGKAMVIGTIKCNRSGRIVEAISTNPDLFPKSTQLKLF